MAEDITIIYFSDGTNETVSAPVRRVEQMTTRADQPFMQLTTVDGRRINANRTYITHFGQPPQQDENPPAIAPKETPLEITGVPGENAPEVLGVRVAALNLARSISLAISAWLRGPSHG